MNALELYEAIEKAIVKVAPDTSAIFKSEVKASGVRRRSGKLMRGFVPKVHKDNSTGEVWGVSYSILRYAYILNNGTQARSVTRREKQYATRGIKPFSFLERGLDKSARVLGDEVAKHTADYVVKAVGFELRP